MTSLNSPGALGNVVSRLKGLKNVNPRRVKTDAPFIPELESPEMDVAGTAPPFESLANLAPPSENLPQNDMGGELTAQSYDVRANSAMPPEEEDQAGFFRKIGRALGDYINPEKRAETTQYNKELISRAQGPSAEIPVPTEEAIGPVFPEEPGVTPEMPNKPYGLPEMISGAWEGAKNLVKGGLTPSISSETYAKMPFLKKPESIVQEEAQRQEEGNKDIDNALKDPYGVVAYGATDKFANTPELVSSFNQYAGFDFTKQEQEMTKKYEKVLSDIDKGYAANEQNYDEQEKRINERIINNQATDADKFYIGLALLMPLLVGGFFGKEAALGALGGGAEGIAKILGGRQKSIREDEELLADIRQQRSSNAIKRGELEIEKMKIPSEVKKSIPKDEYEDLKGMKIYSFKDPNTGEIVAEGPEILPDLYLDLQYGNTPKKRESAAKDAHKLAEEKAALERANAASADVIKAISQIENPGLISRILAYSISDEKDSALKKYIRANAPEIVIDGRKQNSAVYLDSKLELIKDAYRRNENMKAFTQTVSSHIKNMAENPLYSGLEPKDLIDQMLILRDRAQNFFVDRANSQGFLRQPLENKFGKMNREIYKGLNRKEEINSLERDKQLMHASE